MNRNNPSRIEIASEYFPDSHNLSLGKGGRFRKTEDKRKINTEGTWQMRRQDAIVNHVKMMSCLGFLVWSIREANSCGQFHRPNHQIVTTLHGSNSGIAQLGKRGADVCLLKGKPLEEANHYNYIQNMLSLK